ncbi:hypothetical protein FQZ97_1000780 [compost metagenome]
MSKLPGLTTAQRKNKDLGFVFSAPYKGYVFSVRRKFSLAGVISGERRTAFPVIGNQEKLVGIVILQGFILIFLDRVYSINDLIFRNRYPGNLFYTGQVGHLDLSLQSERGECKEKKESFHLYKF